MNGDVRLYDSEKNLIHTLKTMEPIAALRFGPYAREDGALAVVSTAGGWTSTAAGWGGVVYGTVCMCVPYPQPFLVWLNWLLVIFVCVCLSCGC